MYSLMLVIQYDGSAYWGFQRLNDPGKPTVQEVFEERLKSILGHSVGIYGCGRTDRGVHALNQVISFKVKRDDLPAAGVVRQLEDILPDPVQIRRWSVVHPKFHPLQDVVEKSYTYLLVFGRRLKPFYRNYVWEVPFDVDVDRMRSAAEAFVGEHDFGSFANGWYPPERRVKRVIRIRIMKIPHMASGLAVRVTGSGFLHRMVRRIVGAIVDAGRGRHTRESLEEVMRDRSLRSSYIIAPATGLYLSRVKYQTEE